MASLRCHGGAAYQCPSSENAQRSAHNAESASLLFGFFKNKEGRRSCPDQRPPSASVSLISVELFLGELYFFPDEIRDNRQAVLDF